MRLILMEDIDNLGKAGAVVSVKPGYARNYLLPRKLALEATSGSLKVVEHQKRVVASTHARLVKDAQDQANALSAIALKFERQAGGEGRLFGSVTSIDIHRELTARGQTVDRRRIQLRDPIKSLGDFEVPVRFTSGVVATVKVSVVAQGGSPAAAAPASTPAESSSAA